MLRAQNFQKKVQRISPAQMNLLQKQEVVVKLRSKNSLAKPLSIETLNIASVINGIPS